MVKSRNSVVEMHGLKPAIRLRPLRQQPGERSARPLHVSRYSDACYLSAAPKRRYRRWPSRLAPCMPRARCCWCIE